MLLRRRHTCLCQMKKEKSHERAKEQIEGATKSQSHVIDGDVYPDDNKKKKLTTTNIRYPDKRRLMQCSQIRCQSSS